MAFQTASARFIIHHAILKSGAAAKEIPPSFKLSLLSSPARRQPNFRDQPSSVRSFGLEA